jgi:HAE1 family hydrophobic/amphiphilic exporter-1
MTAFAFILGCVPLWVAAGAGAVSRQVLGTVVIGGMLAASILAIFFIPVSFDVVEKFGIWVGGKKELRPPLTPPATAEGTGHDD